MRKYMLTFIVFVMGLSMFYMLYRYNLEGIKRDGIMETLEKSSELSYINALDGSLRVTRNAMSIVSQEIYESMFKHTFLNQSTVNLNDANVNFAFEYLIEAENGEMMNTSIPQKYIENGAVVKGIRNTVWIDGQAYSVRYILDISKGRE